MAKKSINPAEMPVEEKLKRLYQLQTILTQVDEKRALRGELPLEVQDIEAELEGLKTRVEKINNDLNELNDAKTAWNEDKNKAAAFVERYKKQLDDVRNNREYETLSKEIEYQELEMKLADKKLGEIKLKSEERAEELKKTLEAMDERKTDLEIKRTELDEIMDETRAEEDLLKAKAQDLETQIEPRLLLSFKRIRKNARNGLGVVPVMRDACGGCFAKIPPQRQLDIKIHKKIIICEYCGRILVDPELVGIEAKKEAEEKPKRKRTVRKAAATNPEETEEKVEN